MDDVFTLTFSFTYTTLMSCVPPAGMIPHGGSGRNRVGSVLQNCKIVVYGRLQYPNTVYLESGEFGRFVQQCEWAVEGLSDDKVTVSYRNLVSHLFRRITAAFVDKWSLFGYGKHDVSRQFDLLAISLADRNVVRDRRRLFRFLRVSLLLLLTTSEHKSMMNQLHYVYLQPVINRYRNHWLAYSSISGQGSGLFQW